MEGNRAAAVQDWKERDMKLGELLEQLLAEHSVIRIQGEKEAEVTALVYDSRKAVPSGSAFFVSAEPYTTDMNMQRLLLRQALP